MASRRGEDQRHVRQRRSRHRERVDGLLRALLMPQCDSPYRHRAILPPQDRCAACRARCAPWCRAASQAGRNGQYQIQLLLVRKECTRNRSSDGSAGESRVSLLRSARGSLSITSVEMARIDIAFVLEDCALRSDVHSSNQSRLRPTLSAVQPVTARDRAARIATLPQLRGTTR